jgi:hypothetical protein
VYSKTWRGYYIVKFSKMRRCEECGLSFQQIFPDCCAGEDNKIFPDCCVSKLTHTVNSKISIERKVIFLDRV